MSTLLRRDPRTMFPDLVEWFEEPFMTLRPYLAQPIRVEDYLEDDHYIVRAELAGIDPEKDVEVTVGAGYLTIHAERHDKTEGKHQSGVPVRRVHPEPAGCRPTSTRTTSRRPTTMASLRSPSPLHTEKKEPVKKIEVKAPQAK